MFKINNYDKIENSVISTIINNPTITIPTLGIDCIDDSDGNTAIANVEVGDVTMEDGTTKLQNRLLLLNENVINCLSDETIDNIVEELLTREVDVHPYTITATDIEEELLTLHVNVEKVDVDVDDKDTTYRTIEIDIGKIKNIVNSKPIELESNTVTNYTTKMDVCSSGKGIAEDSESIGISRWYDDDMVITSANIDEVKSIEYILGNSINTSGYSKGYSASSSNRIKPIRYATNNSKIFVKNIHDTGKNMKIVLILDRSGSMGGQPANDSATLLTALNNLCIKYRELGIKAIYTDNSCNSTLTLPVGGKNNLTLLSSTEIHGAEGLRKTLKDNEDIILEADKVLVYTDGCIESGGIDKSYYTSRGVEFIGMYTLGKKPTSEEYSKHYNTNKSWFHKVLLEATVTELAELVAQHLKK